MNAANFTLLEWFNIFGLAVFALSGVLTAIRKKFDPIGILVISTVTSIGGGTIRDLLLGIRPVTWVGDVRTLVIILATTLISMIVIRVVGSPLMKPPYIPLLVADALGLALFTLGGIQIAENEGTHWLIALVMGTITGAAGGVLRDVLTSETPLLFRQTELYATTAIVGGSLYLVLEHFGSERDLAAVFGMTTIALLRLAALRWKLKLPVLQLAE